MTSSTTTGRQSEIITIGDEVLRGDVVNGNASYIGRALSALAMPPRWSCVIPDDRETIQKALECALDRSHVVILTGGLGPTPDDLTRDAVADYFGLELAEDAELLEHVQGLFRMRGMEMPAASRNQALFPVGAHKIPNPHGTATGIHVIREERHLFALPGVPVEMRQMTEDYVVPTVRAEFPEARVLTRTLRLAGIGESLVLQQLGSQLDEIMQRVWVAYLPHHGLLDIRLTALASDSFEAEAQIAFAEAVFRERIGEHVYATGQQTLPEVMGQVLVNRGQMLATAESCTGGLVADMLTDTPGSSRWFERGWITYSNQAKAENLGVATELLKEHGAVSEAVARAMAEGARRQAGASWGISTTGIAGPDGGTAEKPVGTVWIAVAPPTGATLARHLQLSGLRETIKLRTAHSLLYFLYRQLMDVTG